ncbi:hypothetical protein [Martelella soudanensis]|uniref:hypothetical protein n=1 Tax=Martelella sp. NC20 TaxID=2740298 RepID=UPI0015DE3232|nr:hypothetical protein [Martelella sp. NC20]
MTVSYAYQRICVLIHINGAREKRPAVPASVGGSPKPCLDFEVQLKSLLISLRFGRYDGKPEGYAFCTGISATTPAQSFKMN